MSLRYLAHRVRSSEVDGGGSSLSGHSATSDMILRPTIKCDGVCGSCTCTSLAETTVRRREFKTFSTSNSTVRSSSAENLACVTIFLKHSFTHLTRCSNTPPHHGALGTLKIHFSPQRALAAALNILPLSLRIWWGTPLLATKCRKLLRKAEWSDRIQGPCRLLSHHSTIEADPDLLHASFALDIERAGKVNTRECEWQCLFDSEEWKWGWSGCVVGHSFMPPACGE